MKIKFICDKCGKEQQPDKKQSNKNWNVFPTVKCECGVNYKVSLSLPDQEQLPNSKTE